MKKLNFKEVYEFPLEMMRATSSKIFTKSHNMAFDFPISFLKGIYPNLMEISVESRKKILDIINGDRESSEMTTKLKLRYDPDTTVIYHKHEGVDREFIIVRGWGHLTGVGGLNLSAEEATRIQTEFAEYIIEKLTNI